MFTLNGKLEKSPLNSVIAADVPVTCAAYAKEKNICNLGAWKRIRHLIKKEQQLKKGPKTV